MDLNLSIRDVNEGDFEAIALLLGELGYPSKPEEVANRFEKILNDNNFKTFVAETDNMVIGFIGLCKTQAYENNSCYVRIGGFVVNENYRTSGVGTRLIEAAENWAKAQGAFALMVASGVQRKAAHAFYSKRNYNITDYNFMKRF